MNNKRVDEFLEVASKMPATKTVESPDKAFLTLFGDFKAGTTEEVIRQLYAETFYFNDTFKTFGHIDELLEYMPETADATEVTTVEVIDVAKSDTDYYLRWVMHMKFSAAGKKIDSKSIGMTQLRFNEEGKIILHQDYWDGAEGFYSRLPIVGFFVNYVQSRL